MKMGELVRKAFLRKDEMPKILIVTEKLLTRVLNVGSNLVV